MLVKVGPDDYQYWHQIIKVFPKFIISQYAFCDFDFDHVIDISSLHSMPSEAAV